MQGNELHAKVWDKRQQIIEEIEFLLRQLKACDDTLASLPPPAAEPPPAPVPAAPTVATPPAVAPAPANPPAPSAPPIAPELLEPYTVPGVHRPGALAVRVEAAVADCGPTFTVEEVVTAFRARYKTTNRPTRDLIAGTLWRIARQRGYKILRTGRGRTPTLYGKPDNTNSA